MCLDGNGTSRGVRCACVADTTILAQFVKTIKQTASRVCVAVGVLLFTVPVALQGLAGIRADDYLAFTGIQNSGELVYFIPAVFIFIAGALLFPFREEEGWECGCGYDLSYSGEKSTRCPECGAAAQLEWTSKPGEYTVKTTRRIYRALLCFLLATTVVSLGIFIKIATG